jgi:hypothetical protein
MADPVNADIERAFALINGPFAIVDDQVATVTQSQATGLRVRGQIFVITQSVATASVVLPSIGGGDASPMHVVINESPNTIRVGASAGPPGQPAESINGTPTAANFATGFLNLITKASAICIASQVPFGSGGGPTASPNNWHVQQFT